MSSLFAQWAKSQKLKTSKNTTTTEDIESGGIMEDTVVEKESTRDVVHVDMSDKPPNDVFNVDLIPQLDAAVLASTTTTEASVPVNRSKNTNNSTTAMPAHESWVGDMPEIGENGSVNGTKKKETRYDFAGNVLPPTLNIPTQNALHHHGEDQELPGYTINELKHLCRSSNDAQRCIALDTLSKVFMAHAELDILHSHDKQVFAILYSALAASVGLAGSEMMDAGTDSFPRYHATSLIASLRAFHSYFKPDVHVRRAKKIYTGYRGYECIHGGNVLPDNAHELFCQLAVLIWRLLKFNSRVLQISEEHGNHKQKDSEIVSLGIQLLSVCFIACPAKCTAEIFNVGETVNVNVEFLNTLLNSNVKRNGNIDGKEKNIGTHLYLYLDSIVYISCCISRKIAQNVDIRVYLDEGFYGVGSSVCECCFASMILSCIVLYNNNASTDHDAHVNEIEGLLGKLKLRGGGGEGESACDCGCFGVLDECLVSSSNLRNEAVAEHAVDSLGSLHYYASLLERDTMVCTGSGNDTAAAAVYLRFFDDLDIVKKDDLYAWTRGIWGLIRCLNAIKKHVNIEIDEEVQMRARCRSLVYELAFNVLDILKSGNSAFDDAIAIDSTSMFYPIHCESVNRLVCNVLQCAIDFFAREKEKDEATIHTFLILKTLSLCQPGDELFTVNLLRYLDGFAAGKEKEKGLGRVSDLYTEHLIEAQALELELEKTSSEVKVKVNALASMSSMSSDSDDSSSSSSSLPLPAKWLLGPFCGWFGDVDGDKDEDKDEKSQVPVPVQLKSKSKLDHQSLLLILRMLFRVLSDMVDLKLKLNKTNFHFLVPFSVIEQVYTWSTRFLDTGDVLMSLCQLFMLDLALDLFPDDDLASAFTGVFDVLLQLDPVPNVERAMGDEQAKKEKEKEKEKESAPAPDATKYKCRFPAILSQLCSRYQSSGYGDPSFGRLIVHFLSCGYPQEYRDVIWDELWPILPLLSSTTTHTMLCDGQDSWRRIKHLLFHFTGDDNGDDTHEACTLPSTPLSQYLLYIRYLKWAHVEGEGVSDKWKSFTSTPTHISSLSSKPLINIDTENAGLVSTVCSGKFGWLVFHCLVHVGFGIMKSECVSDLLRVGGESGERRVEVDETSLLYTMLHKIAGKELVNAAVQCALYSLCIM